MERETCGSLSESGPGPYREGRGPVDAAHAGAGALLDKAKAKGIFGTKMARSSSKPTLLHQGHRQQFDVAGQISAAGLVPIIEPGMYIRRSDKAKAEEVCSKRPSSRNWNVLPGDQLVMLKLTLPEQDNSRSASVIPMS